MSDDSHHHRNRHRPPHEKQRGHFIDKMLEDTGRKILGRQNHGSGDISHLDSTDIRLYFPDIDQKNRGRY